MAVPCFVGCLSWPQSHQASRGLLPFAPRSLPLAPSPRSTVPYHAGKGLLTTRCLAPSGIDGLPLSLQAATFVSIFAGLGLGTAVLSGPAFSALERALPEGWFSSWKKTWPLLGLVYVLAGVAHFTAKDAFLAIYPPLGTWGLWFLPGSAEFHVAWTGVAEVLGGSGLLLGGILHALGKDKLPGSMKGVKFASALALFFLTVAVTPANIYMYTHGATMPGLGPPGEIPVSFHAVRGLLQVVLLSLLWGMSAGEGSEKSNAN
eukprot:761777-Hanusia_phi.AAC.4